MLHALLVALFVVPVAGAVETSISGLVFEFGGIGKIVPNARVCVLEAPNHTCVDSGPDGVYRIPLTLNDIGPTPVTVVLGEFGYQTMRAPTVLLDASMVGDPRLQTMHLQSVTGPLYAAFRRAVSIAARETLLGNRCHIAGTVADYSKNHHYTIESDGTVNVDYAGFLEDTIHGFPGTRVQLYAASWPTMGWAEVVAHGPIYTSDRVLPAQPAELRVTSSDGGFFFYNLPEGHYKVEVEDTRAGHTAGHSVRFTEPVYVDCTRDETLLLPGVFANISPPTLAALEEVPFVPNPDADPLRMPSPGQRRNEAERQANWRRKL